MGPRGPGAIYKLDALSGFRPRVFATIILNGRPNSGAALGNLAYDKTNKQLFVSDLETGMIHRIGLDGSDRGFFDHGTQGRTNFRDAQTQQPGSLPAIAFNPASQARIADCPARFDTSPECWNVAASGRRVWGWACALKHPARRVCITQSGAAPAFNNAAWNTAPEDDKRNSVWSVGNGRTAHLRSATSDANSFCRTSSHRRTISRAPATAIRRATSRSRPVPIARSC